MLESSGMGVKDKVGRQASVAFSDEAKAMEGPGELVVEMAIVVMVLSLCR